MKKMKKCRVAVLLSGLLMLWSCNTDYPNLLKEGYGDDASGRSVTAKKVLYVIVDGTNGDVLKAVSPVNITAYADHALYSYESLMDIDAYKSNEASGWTTLLTGMNPLKHGVHDTNTQPDFENYPTIFQQLDNDKKSLYTSSANFGAIFGSQTQQSKVYESDEALKNELVSALSSSESDLIVANFSGVDKAGQAGGYTLNNTAYVQAIQTIDQYTKELVDAIKLRKNYTGEDWLIVLTTNRGEKYGMPSPSTNHFLVPEKNNFILFYNPKFSSRYYARPGTQIPFDRGILRFTMNPSPTSNSTKAIMASGNEFNINFPTVGSGQTIQFKIKYSGNGASGSWPEFLTKGASSSNVTGGYTLFSSSGSTGFQFKANTTGGATAISNVPIGNDNWHTFTIVFAKEQSNVVMMRVYLDGTQSGSVNLGNISTLSNTYPITIGRIASGSVNGSPTMSISQFTMFNIPLTATDVQNSYCKTEVDNSHPGYANLIGLWRFDEMKGTTVPNKVNNNPQQAFLLSGLVNWEQYNGYSPLICPPVTDSYYKVVPFAADIPLTIMQWLGAKAYQYNTMDGRSWSFNYTNLKAE